VAEASSLCALSIWRVGDRDPAMHLEARAVADTAHPRDPANGSAVEGQRCATKDTLFAQYLLLQDVTLPEEQQCLEQTSALFKGRGFARGFGVAVSHAEPSVRLIPRAKNSRLDPSRIFDFHSRKATRAKTTNCGERSIEYPRSRPGGSGVAD